MATDTTAWIANLTAQRDDLRSAAQAAITNGSMPRPQELLRQAATLTAILAELSALGIT